MEITASVGHSGRNRPADVKVIQRLLNRYIETGQLGPQRRLDPNGVCGQETLYAIWSFQKNVVQMARPDRRVDPRGRTLRRLNVAPISGPLQRLPGPQAQLAAIASRYLGARETGNNRMGTDRRMREIFEADDLAPRGRTDGYPWCAAFVSLCVQKLVRQNPVQYISVVPPREPSVRRFLRIWARSQNCLIFRPGDAVHRPAVGDIVVFRFSHIGIVERVGAARLTTIEGNTDSGGSREGVEVARKSRRLGHIRAFIRLPIATGDFPVTRTDTAYA